MVTCGFRRSELQVRFLTPHPLFLLLTLIFLSISVSAVEAEVEPLEHYSAAPDVITLADALMSDQSLYALVGRPASGDYLGIYFSSFGSTDGLVMSIDGYSFASADPAVRRLADIVYSVAYGASTDINSVSVANDTWLSSIYNQLTDISNQLISDAQYLSTDFIKKDFAHTGDGFYISNGSKKSLSSPISVPTLLALLNNNLVDSLNSPYGFLDDLGGVKSDGKYRSIAEITRYGFAGLATLLSGTENHTILGLSSAGEDKEGLRTNWSIADITGNGFAGLATLIAGKDRTNYNWLGQSGRLQDGQTSLMDMLGDGFLGLAYALTGDPGSRGITLQYYDPDTGLWKGYQQYNNLYDFLGPALSELQNPLTRLAYVLADSDDIQLKADEKENMDAARDEFFGDGQAAVKPSDIKDVAGMSSSLTGAFSGVGSPADAFLALNDDKSFGFFSQEVADALDTVNAPAALAESDDDFFSNFFQDDDGYFYLIDLSPWDVQSYLGGD